MSTFIFIHGGESFETEDEYLNWIQTTGVEWNLDPVSLSEQPRKWKNELAEILTLKGERVYMPDFPNPRNAKYTEWKLFFDPWISKIIIEGDIILIGNSLGGCFLLKYLAEELHERIAHKIHQVHLIATCISAGDFDSPEDYNTLMHLGERVHIWHAEDDPVVSIDDAHTLKKTLPNAVTHFFGSERGYGHFYPIEKPEELINELTLTFSPPMSQVDESLG